MELVGVYVWCSLFDGKLEVRKKMGMLLATN